MSMHKKSAKKKFRGKEKNLMGHEPWGKSFGWIEITKM
jgi:hypothetical protein